MEPWQYSALQTQFSSLLQLLSSNSQNSRSNPTPNNNSANGQLMNMDSCNDEALCRTGIKRKLSDSGNQDNLDGVKQVVLGNLRHKSFELMSVAVAIFETKIEKFFVQTNDRFLAPSKKSGFKQHIEGHAKLVFDVYTQTNASYVADQNSTMAKLADLVLENTRRLDSIENLLTRMERRISILGPYSMNIDKDAKKPALTVEVKPTSSFESVRTPTTPSTPASFMSDVETNETTLGQTVNLIKSPMTTVAGIPLRLQGIPVTAQSNPFNALSHNPLIQQSVMQGIESSAKLTNQDSRTESQTKGLEMNDGASNVLVPVIFAPEDKTRRCTTAEVVLQDLLNGNVTNPEDNIQIFRGSWLGDRIDPHSRVWYYGDFKVIQRAEASGSNPAKLSLNLLEALFTREEMASSNVNGARGRDLLDPIKIKAIYVHINYKFPTDPDKQELRWHFLKPRIDSKCRAQRRIQRDHQAVGDPHHSNKERPFRSNHIKSSIDPKIKEELLYGLMKSDGASSASSRVVSQAIDGANGDAGNSEISGNFQTSANGQSSLVYGNNTL